MLTRDVEIKDTHPKELLLQKHIQYLTNYAANKDGYEQIMVEYLRMNGMYWGLTALHLMKHNLSQGEKFFVFISLIIVFKFSRRKTGNI